MITLTTPIIITNNIPRIIRFRLDDAHDYNGQTPPYLIMNLSLIGPGAVVFDTYNLLVRDVPGLSTVLSINPAPTEIKDQFQLASAALAGNQYTALAAVYAANTTGTRTKAKALAALEAALVGAGVLPAAFAGT